MSNMVRKQHLYTFGKHTERDVHYYSIMNKYYTCTYNDSKFSSPTKSFNIYSEMLSLPCKRLCCLRYRGQECCGHENTFRHLVLAVVGGHTWSPLCLTPMAPAWIG